MKKQFYLFASIVLPFGAPLQSAKGSYAPSLPLTDSYTSTVDGIAGPSGVMTFDPSNPAIWSTDPIDGYNDTPLPDGTSFAPGDPLDITLDLAAPIGVGNNIGFGFGLIASFDPGIPVDDLLWDVDISLYGADTELADFGYCLYNETSPGMGYNGTDPVTNLDLIVGLPENIVGGSFDQVRIVVSLPSLAPDPDVTNFSFDVIGNAAVSDCGCSLVSLVFGLAGLVAFARRESLPGSHSI